MHPLTCAALHSATLQRIHVLKEQLREDLNSLCLEPNFTEMLKHFSSQRLTERLDMFQSRVQALLSTFSRWAAAASAAVVAAIAHVVMRLCAATALL